VRTLEKSEWHGYFDRVSRARVRTKPAINRLSTAGLAAIDDAKIPVTSRTFTRPSRTLGSSI
jgi:hypothetical protein